MCLAPVTPTTHLPSSMLQFPYFSQPGSQRLRRATATGAVRLAALLWGVVSQTHADMAQNTKKADKAQLLMAARAQCIGFMFLVHDRFCIVLLCCGWRPRPAAKQMAVW